MINEIQELIYNYMLEKEKAYKEFMKYHNAGLYEASIKYETLHQAFSDIEHELTLLLKTEKAKIGQSDPANSTNALVVGLPSLSDDELARLFDEKYGSLDDSTVLSHQEYLEHRKWQIESGFFLFD